MFYNFASTLNNVTEDLKRCVTCFIDRGRLLTEKLVGQGYTLEKIEDLLSKIVWSIQRYGTRLQYSPFTCLV